MVPPRLAFVDYLRAGSILYIVGFWHMMEYAPAWAWCQSAAMSRVTVVVLGLFVFISGYLLGSSPPAPGIAGILAFYKRRLLRIYPLYLAGLLAFLLLGLTNWWTAAKSAAGLSMLFGPAPLTLWFVVMLLGFYVLAPVLIGTRMFLAAGVLVFLATAVAVWVLPRADGRLVVYMPSFLGGLYAARRALPRTTPVLALVAAGACWWASLRFEPSIVQALVLAGLAAAGAVAVFLTASCWSVLRVPSSAVQAIGYAAFAMYLFHRPILVLMHDWWAPATAAGQVLYLLGLCLPIIVISSWLLQKSCDRLLRGTAPHG